MPTAARVYQDFFVELRTADEANDTFTVAVVRNGQLGELPTAQVALSFAKETTKHLKRLDVANLKEKDAIALGKVLCDRLLPDGAIRNAFRNARQAAGTEGGVRLRIIARDPQLANVPWEFVYLPLHTNEDAVRNFLLLDPRVSITRHDAVDDSQPEFTPIQSLQLLFASAGPDSLFPPLDLEADLNAIQAAFPKDTAKPSRIELLDGLHEKATVSAVSKALSAKVGIFHFSGHGVFDKYREDETEIGSGNLILLKSLPNSSEPDPDLLPAPWHVDKLIPILKQSGVRLVVLGACETGRRDDKHQWTGIAPALIEAGVGAVIAMQYKVKDSYAIAFFQSFYSALANGLSIDEAMTLGRLTMVGQSDKFSTQWGVPVLYSRAVDTNLFPTAAPEAQEAAANVRRVIQQSVKTVESGGKVVGVIFKGGGGGFEVQQKIDTVSDGGMVIGAVIGSSDSGSTASSDFSDFDDPFFD